MSDKCRSLVYSFCLGSFFNCFGVEWSTLYLRQCVNLLIVSDLSIDYFLVEKA